MILVNVLSILVSHQLMTASTTTNRNTAVRTTPIELASTSYPTTRMSKIGCVRCTMHAIQFAIDEKLCFAPIERPHAVLDIGTGTGLWAIAVADEHPQASVVGTDLSPIMPEMVPPNLEFEIYDADDDWCFSRKFDLIHSRTMYDFTLKSWPHFFTQAFGSLLPGGWVECQEVDLRRRSDDNTIPEISEFKFWEDEWTRGLQKIGLQGTCDPELVMQQMREAGFINVTLEQFKMPIGLWPSETSKQQSGWLTRWNLMQGLYGLSAKIFYDLLEYSQHDLERLIHKCRREVLREDIRSYYPLHVVMGQRPRLSEDIDTCEITT